MRPSVWREMSGRPLAYCFVGSLLFTLSRHSFAEDLPAWKQEPVKSQLVTPASSYGASLAISGSTALIGAPDFPSAGGTTGAVLLFEHDAGVWSELTRILPPSGRHLFGSVVAMTSNHFAVASVGDENPSPIRLVLRANFANAIDLPPVPGSSSYFGYALAMQETTLFVGDPFANDGAGRVAVYRLGEGGWAVQQLLPDVTALPGLSGAAFGASLASGSNQVIVGAPFKDGAGAVYEFRRANEAEDFAPAAAAIPTPVDSVSFGWSLALDESRGLLAVADNGFAKSAGAIQVYGREQQAWAPQGPRLRSSDLPNQVLDDDFLGNQLCFSRGALLATAPGRTQGSGKGSLLAYSRVGAEWKNRGPLSNTPGMGVALAASPEGIILATAFNSVYAYSLDLGSTCQTGGVCQSGNCVEAVCCDTKCDGLCESCLDANTAGALGECRPILSGHDPDAECEASADGCKTDSCNGAGACAVAPLDQICKESMCASETAATPAARCNGFGGCITPPIIECALGSACADGDCQLSIAMGGAAGVGGGATSGGGAGESAGGTLGFGGMLAFAGAGGSSAAAAGSSESGKAAVSGAGGQGAMDDGTAGAAGEMPDPRGKTLTCSSASDCDRDAGFYCLEGACVSGAQCAKQENAAYDESGTKTLCTPSTCSHGACASPCVTTRTDCVDGYICDPGSSSCVLATTFAAQAPGSVTIDCAFGAPRPSDSGWLALGSALALALRLRRRTLERKRVL